jgi:hypothetical protein
MPSMVRNCLKLIALGLSLPVAATVYGQSTAHSAENAEPLPTPTAVPLGSQPQLSIPPGSWECTAGAPGRICGPGSGSLDSPTSISLHFNPAPGTIALGQAEMVPNTARRVAQTAADAVKSIASTIRDDARRIANLDPRLRELTEKLQRLLAEKSRVMEEYAHGYFCSRCLKSKSEIEAGGENFLAHLKRVNGEMIPATPEQTTAKALEFDTQIASLQAQQAAASTEKQQLEIEEREARQQFQEGVAFWYGVVQTEPDFINANAEAVEHECRSTLREAEQQLAQIAATKRELMKANALTKEKMDLLNSEASTWESERSAMQAALAQNSIRSSSELATAAENRVRQWAQVTDATQQISSFQPLQLPAFDHKFGLPGGADLSVSAGTNHLGVGFHLEKWLSVGMDVTTTSNEMNAQGFWALADRVKLQAGVVTSLTPEGITTTDTGAISTPLGNLDLTPNAAPKAARESTSQPLGNLDLSPPKSSGPN